jgi:hypothetical protein
MKRPVFLDSLFVTLKLAAIICSYKYNIDVIVLFIMDMFEAV